MKSFYWLIISFPIFGMELEKKDHTGEVILADLSHPSPRSASSHHHHLAITIDRDTPPQTPRPDIPPNRLKYQLAVVSGVTAVISAGLTALVTILSVRKDCPH